MSGNTISIDTTLTGTTTSRFGESVAISGAGTVLAVGAPNTAAGSNLYGRVVVYAKSGGIWTQRGANIEKTTETSAKAGSSIALSSDGAVLAVGSPNFSTNIGKVTTWRWNGTTWVEFGNAIVGTTSAFFGKRVAMNSAGTILAISSDLNNGTVHTYQLVNDVWTQLGTSIVGAATGDANGTSISLNGAGTILAIGAPGNDTGGNNFGQTRVYALNASNLWVQRGNSINGKSADDESGASVTLSSDGDTLVIGAPGASNSGLTTNGRVVIYRFTNGTWKLVAGDINGTSSSERSGSRVAITPDASKILIGAPNFTSASLSNRGTARLFEFATTTISSSNVWCSGTNTGNKFGLAGNSNTWRTIGVLPSGYAIVDFYCGNGYESNTVNFVKAYRASDQKFYLFVAGANDTYSAGIGYAGAINSWTILNLQSSVIEKIIDVQTVASYGYGDYSVLHLNDGTLYFAGYSAFIIEPALPNNYERIGFTRIK